MSGPNLSPKDIQPSIQRVANQAWFDKLARLGYASKGLVYFVVGLLAGQTAMGTGQTPTDTNGALAEIVTQPFGKFLLVIVALGLIGYALWRVVQTILDPEHAGQEVNAKRVAQRLGYALSAITYTGLAFTALKLILGSSDRKGDSTRDWTARLLAQPFGQWLVGLTGLVVIGVSLAFFYEAYKAKFRRHFKHNEMSQQEQLWANRFGRFGIAARGVVFTIIGIFLIVAAIQSNASQARGLSGVLETLASQPSGSWLLGLVALGLIAYSFYSIAEARYRRLG